MSYINRSKKLKQFHELHRYERGLLPWGGFEGPWMKEYDFCKAHHFGVTFIVHRNPEKGTLSAHVRIPESHPLSEEDISVIDPQKIFTISEWHGESGLVMNPSNKNEFLWDESGPRARWIGCDHSGLNDVIPQAGHFEDENRTYRPFWEIVKDCIEVAGYISSFDSSECDDLSIEEIMESFEWFDE